MSGSLAKAIVIAAPVSLLLAWSLWTFTVTHTSAALLRLVGATCLVVVVVVHVAEAMHWFPGMGWGQPDSAGHYIDLTSAVLGMSLLSAGVFWPWATRRRQRR